MARAVAGPVAVALIVCRSARSVAAALTGARATARACALATPFALTRDFDRTFSSALGTALAVNIASVAFDLEFAGLDAYVTLCRALGVCIDVHFASRWGSEDLNLQIRFGSQCAHLVAQRDRHPLAGASHITSELFCGHSHCRSHGFA